MLKVNKTISIFLAVVILLIGNVHSSCFLEFIAQIVQQPLYNEEYRAQLHYSSIENWINDPNGLVFDPSNNTYHMFYQYNPNDGTGIGNQVWGHAVSDDMIHWRELPVAIPQDSLGNVWSGSAVVDEDNTSGFFTDNKPGESKLVALYTAQCNDGTHDMQRQCVAYSKNHGLTWVRPTLEKDGFENPVIPNDNDKYGIDFRDPKVFRFDNKWIMVVAGGEARIFSSDDLIHWKYESDIGVKSECPDIYPLSVNGNKNNVKWVYSVAGDHYCLGELINDNGTYRLLLNDATMNSGGDLYAAQTFYNTKSGFDRKVSISWIRDYTGQFVDDKLWSGLQSIPYDQKLISLNGKIKMTSYPIKEFNSLRNTKRINLRNTTCKKINEKLSENPLRVFDMLVTFKPKRNSVVKLKLRSNGEYSTDIIYDSKKNTLLLDRSHYRENMGDVPADPVEMSLYKKCDGTVSLRIILDTCVVDAFGNEGQAVLCGLTFPESDCLVSKIEVEGIVKIKSFELYSMNSIWHKNKEIQ